MTLIEAQAHLDAWRAADLALAKGQSYTMSPSGCGQAGGGSYQLTRADGATVRERIGYWEGVVRQLSGTSGVGNKFRLADWSD